MFVAIPCLQTMPPSNSDYKEDYGRPVSNRSTQAEARTQRRCMRTSNAPYRAMLSWQQMASFGVHQEGLDDLPQQRGTRESLLPCVVQSRACAHNITGAGGGKSLPPVSGAPHVHHAQRMLHQLGATIWRRSVSVSV